MVTLGKIDGPALKLCTFSIPMLFIIKIMVNNQNFPAFCKKKMKISFSFSKIFLHFYLIDLMIYQIIDFYREMRNLHILYFKIRHPIITKLFEFNLDLK